MDDQGAAPLPDAGKDRIEALMAQFIRETKGAELVPGYADADPMVKTNAILGSALRDACTLLAPVIDGARRKADEMACGGDERWKQVRDEIQGNWISEPLHADVAAECMFEEACRRIAEQETRIKDLRSLVADLADELEPKIREAYATSVPGDMTTLRAAMLDDDLEVVSRARKALEAANV